MNNFFATIREGLSRVRKIWIITAVVVLGLVLGLAGFASGVVGNAIAAFQGKTAVSAVNVQPAATATMAPMPGMGDTPTTMPAMPGMGETPTAMPDMVMATETPVAAQPVPGQAATGDDMDALLMQMQQTMQSLQGMMGQLDQQGTNMMPTAAPAVAQTVDLQPYMAELQDINLTMLPLMQRIQADLQGNPSAEELASVRAQVAQIQERMLNLMNQLQAARSGNPVAAAPAPTMEAMPGMGNMPGMVPVQPTAVWQPGPAQAMDQLDQLMLHMQTMLEQVQSQQQAGTMPSPPGQMDSMMAMMDDMMAKMDNMMGGMAPQSNSMNGMNMATPTPMAGMSNSGASMGGGMMDNMMMMMDNMMMMMDDAMKMEMDMMGMPDM